MKVVFDLISPLARLETKKGKRYNATEIARLSGINRQTLRNFMVEPPEQININTIAKLLAFFESEGLPVTINDLFTVEPPAAPSLPSVGDKPRA